MSEARSDTRWGSIRRRADTPLGEPFGPYILTERLGVGGMAEVYRAERPMLEDRLSKVVAIKRLHASLKDDEVKIRRLVEEARLLLRLEHPNIAQTFELGEVDGIFYIAMEFVDGVTLSGLLGGLREANVTMPVGLALQIAASVARALAEAHGLRDADGRQLGVVHRDISPHNIMLGRRGSVKLIDFGLAKVRDPLVEEASGTAKGHFRYHSPERAQGLDAGPSSDLFALGLVLWEMLTGQHALGSSNQLEALARLQDWQTPPPPPAAATWPEGLVELLEETLAPHTHTRIKDAETLADRLEALLHSSHPGLSPGLLGALVEATEERRIPSLEWLRTHLQPWRPPPPVADPPSSASNPVVTDPSPSPPPRTAPAEPVLTRSAIRWEVVVIAALLALLVAAGIALWSTSEAPSLTPAPAPQKTARADMAEVEVSSTPTDARILINGVASGARTPTRFFFSTGHTQALTVQREGFADTELLVAIDDATHQRLHVRLEPLSASLEVTLSSAADTLIEVAPLSRRILLRNGEKRAVIGGLSIGDRLTLTITREGQAPIIREVTIGQEKMTVNIDL